MNLPDKTTLLKNFGWILRGLVEEDWTLTEFQEVSMITDKAETVRFTVTKEGKTLEIEMRIR